MYRAVLAALLVVCLQTSARAAGRVFVVSKASRSLQVFDATSGKMEFEIKGTGGPHVVVVSSDGKYAYIGDSEGTKNTISVIDVEKQAVAHTIKLVPYIQPHGLALTHDGTKLYATCAPNRAIVEIDLGAGKVTRAFSFLVDSVENLALTPDEKFIFSTSSFDGTLPVIDLTKGGLERMIVSGSGPEGVAVSPDGKEVWVANRVSQTLSVVDVASRKRVALIQCVGNPMHPYFSNDGTRVYVTLAVGDRLGVFDRAKRTEITRFEVGDFPVCMAFGETDQVGFVANGEGADVSVVDLAGYKVVRRFPCGGQPEGIAYSSR